jgi:hypothetical protein
MRSLAIATPFLVLGLFLPACDDDPPLAPPLVTELPGTFHMTGEATRTDTSGLTATCSLDLIFELSSVVFRTPQRVDYQGVHGGAVERAVLARDGSGFAFAADVFGDVEAHLFVTGNVEIVIPVNRTAEGRFWQNLASFSGTVDSSGRGEGRWTCAPFDIDTGGYVDRSVVAEGTWEMEPQE